MRRSIPWTDHTLQAPPTVPRPMLDAEKHLLIQFTVITHEWPMESKVSLRDAILAALNERTSTERERCTAIVHELWNDPEGAFTADYVENAIRNPTT